MTARIEYPTLITLDTATPIAAGRMLPDGSDIRVFSDEAKTQELDFYVENINSAETRLWVSQDHTTGRYHPDIAFYAPMDSNGTDIINGHTATQFGTGTFGTANGQVGGAYEQSGSTDRLEYGDDSDFQLSDKLAGFTVAAWINVRSAVGGSRIMDHLQSGPNRGWDFEITPGGSGYSVAAFLWHTAGNFAAASTTDILSFDTWHHVCAAYDRTAADWIMYVDGTVAPLASSTTGTGPIEDDTVTPINLVLMNNEGPPQNRAIDGYIDSATIYHRTLTADEVRSDYLRGFSSKRLTEPQPTAHWTMNSVDNAGSEIVDLVSGLNGSIGGTVSVGQQGQPGQSFLFDGTSGYVEVADDALMEPHVGGSGTSTWTASIYPESYPGVNATIFSKFQNGPDQLEFVCLMDATGSIIMGINSLPSGATFANLETDVIVPLNQWTHITVTYDASEASNIDKVAFYFNGSLVPHTVAASSGTPTMTSGTAPFSIGARSTATSPARFFDGRIGEVFWSSDLLTDTQIAELARRSREGLRPDLTDVSLAPLAYWSFDNVDIGIEPQDLQSSVKTWTPNGSLLVGQMGPFGHGQSFTGDGSSTSLRGPDSDVDSFFYAESGEGTRSIWFRRPSTPAISTNEWMFFMGIEFREDGLFMTSTGLVSSVWTQQEPNAADTEGAPSTDRYDDGQWHHVVSVIDRSVSPDGAVILYIDGVEVSRDLLPSGWVNNDNGINANARRALFQRWEQEGPRDDQYFNGDLSDFLWIKGTALTASQVSDLYEKGRAGLDVASSVSRVYVTYGNPDLSSQSSLANTFTRQITGLTAAYEFDEETGSTASAAVGTNAILTGEAVPVKGVFGNARRLEGNGIFDIADTVVPAGNGTVAMTLQTEAATGQVLLSNYDGYNDNAGFTLELTADGYVQARQSTGGGSEVSATGSISVNDGISHNIIVAKDTSSTGGIYVDGTLDVTMPAVSSATPATNARIAGYRQLPFVAPSGLILHFEADQGVTLTSDNKVSAWQDQSSSSNDASQGTSSAQPVYQPLGLGGRPSVFFPDGTGLDITLVDLSSSDFTVFAVISPPEDWTNSSVSNRYLMATGTGTNGGIIFGEGTADLAGEVVMMYSFPGSTFSVGVDSITLPSGQPFMVTGSLEGTTEDIRLDGTSQTLQTGSGGGMDSGAGRSIRFDAIGAATQTPTFSLNASLSAMLVFNSKLSVADTDYVERYLALKYGTPLSGSFGDTRASMTIDDLRVFDRTLTVSEISDLAANFGEVSGGSVLVRKRTDPDPTSRQVQ